MKEYITIAASNSTVYYTGEIYWNNYPLVVQEINRRISGDASTPWYLHFKNKTGGRKFRKALVLNCGNGWVERELFRHELFEEAVGVDFSEELLDKARSSAIVQGLPFRYYQLDINNDELPEEGYDLIINHAAAHHIAYLDRVFYRLATLLPEDGYFVNYDYVGPHRNQYPAEQWDAVCRLNERLPDNLRSPLRYPSLNDLLKADPSEAVHSELIQERLRRYFIVEEYRRAGGALAYPLLTHNPHFAAASLEEQESYLRIIMEADAAYLESHPRASLFVYIAAKPDKAGLAKKEATIQGWLKDEELREQTAQGGEYYPRYWLTRLYEDYYRYEREQVLLENLKLELAEAQHRAEALNRELEALKNSRLVRLSGMVRQLLRRILRK